MTRSELQGILHEKESQRKVESLMLTNITELAEDTFNMLMEGESFADLDTSEKQEDEE